MYVYTSNVATFRCKKFDNKLNIEKFRLFKSELLVGFLLENSPVLKMKGKIKQHYLR